MTKNPKQRLLSITALVMILLSSSAYAATLPKVQAADTALVTVYAYCDYYYEGYLNQIPVYIDSNYAGTIIGGQDGITFNMSTGTHTIGVGDWIDLTGSGMPGWYLVFSYFDVGTGGNPTELSVTSDLEVTAHYYMQSS